MAEVKWKGKTRGGLIGYRLFLYVLKHLGISVSYFVLIFVAAYFFFFAPKASRASYYYFREIHQYGFFKSLLLMYQSYYVFGQTILDKVAIMGGYSDNFTFHFDGAEKLAKMSELGQGGILISAHVGNWDIAGHFLHKLDTPINIIMFDGENRKVKELMDKETGEEKKYNIIYIKEDGSHVFEIGRALVNKEFICIHGDRFSPGQASVEHTFMGKQALFPKGPFELVARFKVPYIFVYGIKETSKHYHFYATLGEQTSSSEKDILKEYTESLEKILAQHPKQWFNYYPFWLEQEGHAMPKAVVEKEAVETS